MVDSEKTASSRYSQMDAHMNTQRQWQHTQDLRSFKPSKILACRRSGHTVLPLTKKLFAIDTNPLRKGKPVFYHEVVLGIAFFVLFILYYYFIFCYILFWFGGLFGFFLVFFILERGEGKNWRWVGGQDLGKDRGGRSIWPKFIEWKCF